MIFPSIYKNGLDKQDVDERRSGRFEISFNSIFTSKNTKYTV